MPVSKEKRMERFLKSRSRSPANPVRLRGDASTRSFYRVSTGGRSAVIMALEEPQPGRELSYINVRDHLAACGVSVPEIYEYDAENGILLMEDFGDVTLEDRLKGADSGTFKRFYKLAIEELLKIQVLGTALRRDCVAFSLAFDEEKLMQELDFFLVHTVEGYFKAGMGKAERDAVRSGFAGLAGAIAAYPRVLNHRDYHSRNLMVADGSIKIVDFQDARMGPCQYDMASLLRDSYTVLERRFREEMMDCYLAGSRGMGVEWYGGGEFGRRFDIVSLQRNLKACGTFGHIAVARGNDRYLQYLEPTFAYVRENAARSGQMEECLKILSRHVPYLR